tara:strand:- start:11071 stop:12795 length:1725 start_codon:yes stop_codon:yes gene_type:complete
MNLLLNTLILDIETDGLTPTRIWCCSSNLFPTVYSEAEFKAALATVEVDTIVAHNGIAFDFPVLQKLWNVDLASYQLLDSLVLSRLANPSREGGHSLRAWGERLNFPKGSHNEWEKLSCEMIKYCEQDVAVTEQVLKKLELELREFNPDSIELEHKVQSIIKEQINNGWLLDHSLATSLVAEFKEKLYAIEDEVHKTFKPMFTFIKVITPKIKKNTNEFSKVGLKFLGDDWQTVSGDFCRIEYRPFNLSSRQQIAVCLQKAGWEPDKFTDNNHPIVDESTLANVDIPEAKLIAEYITIQKRKAQVQSWLDVADKDNRVHGYVNTNGAVTGRFTHSKPNMAQVPAVYSPYGKECRSCWIAKEGYKVVGVDASGLELRMLAHYMNNEGYTNEIINGDIHSLNQKLAGLKSRDTAKTFIYAFLYGAGDERLGSVVGGSKGDGRFLREQFLYRVPSLKELRDRVVQKVRSKGTLKGLDGRQLFVRSEHSALNTLLQSAGALVMKKALVLLDEYAKLWGIDFKFVGNIHDEIQSEVSEEKAEEFGKLAVSCIRAAGNRFNLKCPLDGEYKVGDSWEQTH